MGWLRSLFRSSEVIGIAGDTLAFALEAAEDAHPNEFMGMLRGTPAAEFGLAETGLLITDIIVVPGTVSNSVSATVRTSMIPNNPADLGSVHSHPNGVLQPSDQDLASFGRGSVHLILGAPYEWRDWQAFDAEGQPRHLSVYNVDLPDPESFFHFDQADIDAEIERERS